MEKIKREKLVSKIICVALAIVLWLFVLYQENPVTTKTVRDVPLTITGDLTLRDNGFAVYSVSEKSVDVSVTAKRLNLPLFSKKTLSAGINVSSIKKSGSYTLPATASSTADTNASYYVTNKEIVVVIEPIEKINYKVDADISEPAESSLVLSSYELSREKVTVTAPKSVMKDVAYVKTEQFIPKDNKTEHTLKVMAYDKEGKVISDAECSPEEVKITYSLQARKTVPVVITTTSGKKFTLPDDKNITIQGSESILDSIENIETEKIDLSQRKEGETIKIKLKTLRGLKFVDSSDEIEVTLSEEYFN